MQDVIFSASSSADALLTARHVDEARDYLHCAQTTQDATQVRAYASELLRLRGRIHLEEGDYAAAERAFREAIKISKDQGLNLILLRAATDLAQLFGKQGRAAEGASVLRPAYDSFTEGFDFADLVKARAALAGIDPTTDHEHA